MRNTPATIKDIAKQLNISVATVSRALRNLPVVNDLTRKEVHRLALELDYQPNAIARSLLSNRTTIVGVVVPDIATPFFSAAISGIQQEIRAWGYNSMICQSDECYTHEQTHIQNLVANRVEGLIISISRETCSDAFYRSLHNKGVPLVFFDRVCEGIDTSRVVVDDYEGAFHAVEHLIEAGLTKIAHMAGHKDLLISKSRKQGYLDALHKYNLPVKPEWIVPCGIIKENVVEATNYLLGLSDRPHAIFMWTDQVAIQAMLVLKEKGIRIPQDVAVVGFGNEPITAVIEPGLTTVDQFPMEMGRLAAQLLLQQIVNGAEHCLPKTKLIKSELIIRQSSCVK